MINVAIQTKTPTEGATDLFPSCIHVFYLYIDIHEYIIINNSIRICVNHYPSLLRKENVNVR